MIVMGVAPLMVGNVQQLGKDLEERGKKKKKPCFIRASIHTQSRQILQLVAGERKLPASYPRGYP